MRHPRDERPKIGVFGSMLGLRTYAKQAAALQNLGEPALATTTGLGLESIDEIDHVVEPAAGATADAVSCNGDGKMRLASTGPAYQHGVALRGDESDAGEVVDERLVDRRAIELEVVEILGERQLCM
jgi:hypothetical protein